MRRDHIDSEWIESKFKGRSGAWGYNSIYGLARIDYIYKVNKLKIFYYNCVLFIKFLKRRMGDKK